MNSAQTQFGSASIQLEYKVVIMMLLKVLFLLSSRTIRLRLGYINGTVLIKA